MKYIFLLALLAAAIARDDPKYDALYRKKQQVKSALGQEMHWFDQVVDHYDYRKAEYFKQRYWVVKDYFNPRIGPVFLYICGEWVCSGVPELRTWIAVLAQRTQGMILVLEHRFYGDSLPFGKGSFTVQNMRLLNSEQALRDLAYFVEQVQANKLYGVSNNPWISVGGSYPGALSAWFRYKYPHLVIGSLASSAVVNAIEDFKGFDQQIYLSTVKSGDYCANAFNASNLRVEQILYSSPEAAAAFKSQFAGGEKLSNEEFLFFWADTNVLTVQYGGRTSICDALVGKSEEQQFEVMVSNAQQYEVYEYSSYWLRNETMTYETKSAARPWYYQYCTEYGWFQTYSDRHPMRSTRVNLDFFRKFCADAYGEGTWAKVDLKNIEYGGLHEQASNIFFSNGIEDPWRWASMQQTDSEDLIARVIDCPNCAHCIDLYTPELDDPTSLKKVREEEFLTITGWINAYWSQLQRQRFQQMLLAQM